MNSQVSDVSDCTNATMQPTPPNYTIESKNHMHNDTIATVGWSQVLSSRLCVRARSPATQWALHPPLWCKVQLDFSGGIDFADGPKGKNEAGHVGTERGR
ncbi:hypothetical protein N7462_000154 [Penicillium macrosclerotiorum]|uniref:uncharacterized protein n=1 Tax=Penicillium macrosclerotiorum TaxID=303699 RepID=UPI0025474C4F|nr:uncharacterized protein N7462_000154 [Penicillium macrosclerotiorum]KAJ5698149.1 hypothetical protein N7462_000154 [Penicillium macrosclerotiorum]